jgi:hypothetical protein
MIRVVLVVPAILVCVLGSVPVLAQSSVLDFSKPMTGKSRFVINPDGSPLELGGPARPASREARSSAPVVACDGGPCRSGGDASAPTQIDDQSGTDGQSATDAQSGTDEQSGKDNQAEKGEQSEQTKTPASRGEAGDAAED